MVIDIIESDMPNSTYCYTNEFFKFEKSGKHNDPLLGEWEVDNITEYGRSVDVEIGVVEWFDMGKQKEMEPPYCDILERCYVLWKYRKEQKNTNTNNLFK